MNRTLSSTSTFFYKYILPVALVVGFAIAIRSAMDARGAYSAGSSIAIPEPGLLLAVVGVGVAGLVGCARFCAPLKRVRVSDVGDALLVSNYLTEWRVPTGLITEVWTSTQCRSPGYSAAGPGTLVL